VTIYLTTSIIFILQVIFILQGTMSIPFSLKMTSSVSIEKKGYISEKANMEYSGTSLLRD
jgi:hypothetical protein